MLSTRVPAASGPTPACRFASSHARESSRTICDAVATSRSDGASGVSEARTVTDDARDGSRSLPCAAKDRTGARCVHESDAGPGEVGAVER